MANLAGYGEKALAISPRETAQEALLIHIISRNIMTEHTVGSLHAALQRSMALSCTVSEPGLKS